MIHQKWGGGVVQRKNSEQCKPIKKSLYEHCDLIPNFWFICDNDEDAELIHDVLHDNSFMTIGHNQKYEAQLRSFEIRQKIFCLLPH